MRGHPVIGCGFRQQNSRPYFFSPVIVNNDNGQFYGMGSGPMAVLPDHQNQGVGTMPVNKGLRRVINNNCIFVIVLGHPDYYPRFGFERASKYSLRPEWNDIPDEAFMVYIIDKSIQNNISGVARYRSAFTQN